MKRLQFTDPMVVWLSLGGLVMVTALIYWPGLGGPFVLDDWPNFIALARLSDPLNWGQIVNYLFDDIGHRGRYIARASFLFNASDWPNNPTGFKQVNLFLHLFNGVLLAFALRLILRRIPELEKHHRIIVFATVTLWLLHPFNVSTVLYAIQRMTILAGTFTLGGLLVYIAGRNIAQYRPRNGYVVMTAGVGFGVLLGTFSKENGILLPLFILIMEWTLLRTWQRPKGWGWWAIVMLGTPIIFVFFWHIWKAPSILAGYQRRAFSLDERLLTESRILFQYLSNILLPRRLGTGLFHDDIPVSQGLLQPIATLFSVAGIAGLLSFAMLFRKRFAFLSFGILWFVAGHLLESGVVALELYFEHRNYIPMIGPLVALSYYTLRVVLVVMPYVGAAMMSVFIAVCAYNTYRNVQIWRSPVSMAVTWELEHPGSKRALQFAANAWLKAGQIEPAKLRLTRLLSSDPGNTGAASQLILIACLEPGGDTTKEVNRQAAVLRANRLDHAVFPTLQTIIDLVKKQQCPGLVSGELLSLLNSLIGSPEHKQRRKDLGQLYLLKAKLHQQRGETHSSALALRRSFELRPQYRTAILESIEWSNLNEIDKALAALSKGIKHQAKKSGYLFVPPPDLLKWEAHLRQLKRDQNSESPATNP